MMNKKLIKLITTGSAAVMLLAPAAVISAPNINVEAASQKQAVKTVKMSVYKYSKNHKSHKASMATGFVGKSAKVTIKNGKVTKMIIHVDGKNSPMGKGQDVAKIVKSLKINGVKGHKENISTDHSKFDFVFSSKAFKNNGWAIMNVSINFGANINEEAWVKFGKVSGLKTPKKATKKTHKSSHKKVSKKRRK